MLGGMFKVKTEGAPHEASVQKLMSLPLPSCQHELITTYEYLCLMLLHTDEDIWQEIGIWFCM